MLYDFKQVGRKWFALLVYVDDMIVASNDLQLEHQVVLPQSILHKWVDHLSSYFLDFWVARSTAGINICQRKYELELMEESSFLASKPVSSPMEPAIKLS